MNRSRCRPFQFHIAATLAVLTVSHAIAKCAPDATTAHSTVALSTLSIRTSVYVFERSGRFLKGNLATGDWQQISNRAFVDYPPSIVPSADGRWISYSGALKNRTTEEYWLYDKRTGSDRLYHEHPAWAGGIPEFSPDGRAIVLYANYDKRWPSAAGTGLYLIETDTLRSSFLGNPSTIATPANQGFASATWSKDGNELLLMMRGFPPGVEPTREHFAYSIVKKRYERISGEYDLRGERFFRGGSRVAVYQPSTIQSHARHRELISPDGRRIASINRDHELTVNAKGAPGNKVAVGRYDHCSGVTIGVNGWLDAQLMVYTVEDETYVFDAATGRKALLFSGRGRPAAFFW